MSIVIPDRPVFDKFDSWRKYQSTAVEKLANANKKFLLLDSPTGSGKSLIGMSIASAVGGRCYYLVGTKNLQEQLIRDFNCLALLKGRRNFDCLVRDVTCDQCVYGFAKKECPQRCECPYYVHKNKAAESNFVVWNYAMFLTNQTFNGDFPKADLIICDEAHLLESAIMSFVQISFDHDFFNDLGLGFPGKDEEEHIFDRINKAWEIANKRYSTTAGQLQMKLFNDEEPSKIDLKECRDLEAKIGKMRFFRSVYDKDTWVKDYYRNQYDYENDYLVFKPLKVDKFSEYIFSWADKVLLMSATLPNTGILCSSLGIKPSETARLDIPSTFKRENRPIIFKPIGRMSYPNWESTMERVLKYLGGYCQSHLDKKEKIFIHTANYNITSALLNATEWCLHYDVFSHETADTRDETLASFKSAEPPAIMVTPSMESGVDLPGDLCRVQFILKVPYLSLGDIQVQKRMEIDRDWYIASTVNRLVQASGRIVRSEDDWGKTYILDECFADLIKYYKKFFPNWFLEAVCVERRHT